MDPMADVAEEFPDITYLHLTGYKSNGKNFGNFFGAMENFKYLAGMLAGSRAKLDGNPKIGYMATFPIPEELRLGNAIMLGVKQTCPECTMDIRFINTWHDPVLEKEGAASLFDAGAQVVFTGADTGAVADVAQEKDKWGVTYDHPDSCKVDACLTAPYWIWGPEYTRIAEQVKAGTYEAGYEYFDADAGAMGLLGFMEGETPRMGVDDLPAADVQLVKDTLATMLAGKFTAASTSSPARSRTTPASSSSPTARSSSSPTSTSSRPAHPATSARLACTGGPRASTPSSPSCSRPRDARARDDSLVAGPVVRRSARRMTAVPDATTIPEPEARVVGVPRRRDARHRQALPRRRRQRRRRLRRADRGGPRPARRERRRQEHADERARRALPPGRRRDPRRRRPVDLRSPRDAIAAGIGMVHQHFALVPTQTVTENILLGLDEPRFRWISVASTRGSPSSPSATA